MLQVLFLFALWYADLGDFTVGVSAIFLPFAKIFHSLSIASGTLLVLFFVLFF